MTTAILELASPQGIFLDDISWETHEALVEGLGEQQVRVTYDNGWLETMTLSLRHESFGSWIDRLICAGSGWAVTTGTLLITDHWPLITVMDVLDDMRTLISEHAELSEKLGKLRTQNDRDLVNLVEATDSTLLSKNQEQLEELLNSANAKMRCAALCLLDMRNWAAHLEDKCRLLATADVDPDVRGTAVLVLRKLHAQATGRQIEPFFAQIVLDANEKKQVRRAAFRALLDIRGVPLHAQEWKHSLQDGFPTSVDLEFVKAIFP